MDAANDTKFWEKVDTQGPIPEHMQHLGNCWIWTGNKKQKQPYGLLMRNGKIYYAHRYVMGNPDLFVLHHCDNPSCVNPSHLFLGTQADNMHDCAAKGRLTKYQPKKRQWSTVDVLTMRVMRNDGYTYQEIATAFNTTRARIHDALNKYYRDIAEMNVVIV